MCNNTITKDPATPIVCRYTTLFYEMSSVLKGVVGSLVVVLLQIFSSFGE